MSDDLRLAELLCALSLASDLSQGQALEWELRACRLAVALAEGMGLSAEQRVETYWVAMLRYIGCTGHAYEVASLFGDDIVARDRAFTVDWGSSGEVVRQLLRHAGEGLPTPARLRVVGAALAGGRKPANANFRTGCEVAELFATRLGFDAAVRAALWHAFERWDGKGFPNRVKGDAIATSMRIVQVAQDMDVMFRVGGVEHAVDVARSRSGAAYDPSVAEHFCGAAAELLPMVHDGSAWEAVLAAEPVPRRTLAADAQDEALLAVADFADIKSPYTAGHSRAVAELASQAARRGRLPEAECVDVWRAGLVHDLGRTAVSNAVWDKPGALTALEWERVRLHPYYTERMLARVGPLAGLGRVAALHHERVDGSGYHKGVSGPTLSVAARILAAADAYQAMTEVRAFRPARAPAEAARALKGEVESGRLDGDAVTAVLEAAGQRVSRRAAAAAGGLTAREVEVLRLVARGMTAKQIGAALTISPRTVNHHVDHVYTKLGVSTRGAAALYAIQHGLIARGG